MTTISRTVGGAAAAAAEAAKAAAEAAAKAAAAAAAKAAAAAAKKAGEATSKSTFKKADPAKAKREEELKALDAKLQTAGVPDDVRTRTLDRLKKLPAADYARESKLLEGAMSGPNADRAVAAWDKIQTVAASSPEAAKRLTPEIREALVRGVAERRTADDVGQEGVLGVKQAEEAAKALTTMPKEQYDAAARALSQAGVGGASSPRADAQAERALILKAIASRSDRLQPNFIDEGMKKLGLTKTTEAERTMKEITDFAADVRGMPRDELIRTTTAIDIEAANTSKTDPLHLPADGAAPADTRGDNDGLYQRFEDTCGPTTSQMTRAEADPIYARQLHKNGLDSSDPTNPTAVEQRETLEKPRFFDSSDNEVIPTPAQLAAYKKDGTMPPTATSVEIGNTSTRRADQAAERTDTALNALSMPEFAKSACRKLLRGEDLGYLEKMAANYTLGKLREANGGHPTAQEVKWMQTERTDNHNGMRLDPALHDIASPGTHQKYDAKWVGSGGLTSGALNDVDTRLKNGQDVPIRVSNSGNTGGHFMLMSDVRGKSPDRTYLVSDPYSGRTAWVKEADLTDVNSKWLKNQFDLGWTQVSHTYPEK